MKNRERGMGHDHPGAGVPHNRTDFFAHLRLVAVGRAKPARSFMDPIRAGIEPRQSISVYSGAVAAQPTLPPMEIPAIECDHAGNGLFFPVDSVHGNSGKETILWGSRDGEGNSFTQRQLPSIAAQSLLWTPTIYPRLPGLMFAALASSVSRCRVSLKFGCTRTSTSPKINSRSPSTRTFTLYLSRSP